MISKVETGFSERITLWRERFYIGDLDNDVSITCSDRGARGGLSEAPTLAENRIALVIGNANYASVSPLANPANDAKAMVQFLSTAASFARAVGRR